MDDERGISSVFASESASNSWRNGNGKEDKDEFGSKRLKVHDLDPDSKSSNPQSDGNIGVLQQPDLSSEVSELTDAEGLGREVSEKELVAKDRKPFTVLERSTCLPKTDDNRCVANSGKHSLLEDHNVKGDTNVDGVSKISSHFKSKESSLPIARPRGAAELDLLPRDPSLSIPSSEKVVPSQMSSAAGSMGESDPMRRWMEMKRNGFLSGPLGGVPAPSTPVEVPAQKQQKIKRRGDPLKKRNEVTRREQPRGLLNNLKPAIIRHVRTPKQFWSILKALVGNASDYATVGESQANMNVRESVGEEEDRALALKLPSTGVPDNVNSITNPQQDMSRAVEAATLASQWLEFLHQYLSRRLSGVQNCRKRVQSILTTELPLLASSSTLQMMNMDTSGDGSSDKTVTETHQNKWTARFDAINKTLHVAERDLERSLNQVREMLSRCNYGLCQIDKYSPSQSLDSSVEKDRNEEASLAVQAAAASIFSTCNFLQSMIKPEPST